MLSCVAAGVAAGAVGIAVAYLLHRRAKRNRGAEKALQPGKGIGHPVEGGVCIWSSADPINGARIRVAPRPRE